MTEAEWLECTNPERMLDFLRGKASGRKMSLFAVACCRKDHLCMRDCRSRRTIECTEGLIEWLASDDLDAPSVRDSYLMSAAAIYCMAVAWWADVGDMEAASQYVRWVIQSLSESSQDTGIVLRSHAALLRCVFGNPFHPVALESRWLVWNDGTIPKIAQAIYEQRIVPEGTLDNGVLKILADALEEAGCTDTNILEHLRGPGPHVRGCWPVDLCLGKA